LIPEQAAKQFVIKVAKFQQSSTLTDKSTQSVFSGKKRQFYANIFSNKQV
jgi:hypothetical protein